MTPSTPTKTSPRPLGNLPRPRVEEPGTGKAIAAILGSLVLLVGVPVGLVLAVGNPLPTSAPSSDWLTAQVDAALIIKVLTGLVWLVWLHFVVCFLTEWRALRRGRVPGNVLFGGGSQLLARRLVAGILLLAGSATIAGGLAGGASAADRPTRPDASISALVEASIDGAAASDAIVEHTAASAVKGAKGLKMADVQVPDGRHHDSLWAMADRFLGDGLRWKEIYELNRGKLQPDGRRLDDADLIHPGWRMTLPADARGEGVYAAPDATPAPPGVFGDASETAAGSIVQADLDGASTAADTTPVSVTQTDSRLESLLLGGGLILAGLLTALTAKRGEFGTPSDDEGAIRLAADPGRADLVDRALRVLADSRATQALPMPEVAIVYASDDQVIAHIVGSHPAPAAPWVAAEDGTSWSVTAEALAGLTSTAPAPYPALVNVALSHGFDVLVDLEYASGLVSLGGDAGVSREIAMSLAVDLATHAWSDGVEITMVGFGDDLAQIAPDRLHSAAALGIALDEIEHQLAGADVLLARLGVDGVLAGRSTAPHPELKPRVLLLSAPPTATEMQRIRALTGNGRAPFAAICVGDAPSARWRFAVDATGQLDLGVLGVRGTARRFTLAAREEFMRLLAVAAAEAQQRRTEIGVDKPAALLPAQRPGSMATRDAAAQVRLLGPIGVTAPGPTPARQTDVVTELIVMAALHPQGLHDAVLRSGLWPRGVSDDVVERTVAAAGAWLGVDASGAARLRRDEAGLWQLADDVYVDLAALQRAAGAQSGEQAADQRTDEAGELARGLALAGGEAFSGLPAGRYSWLSFHRVARDTRALIASMGVRAAELLLAVRDRPGAETALRNALTMVPSAEVLWRELIRLNKDHPGGPAAVAAQMQAALPDRRLEPETEALVADLAPEALGRQKSS